MRLDNGKYFVVDYYTGLEVVGRVYHFVGDCYYKIDWDDQTQKNKAIRRFERSIEMNHILHLHTFESYEEMKKAFEREYELRNCCLLEILW